MTYQSKWNSCDTRMRKSKKAESANFSVMFLTATLDCATSQISRPPSAAAILVTQAAITVVLPVPGGPWMTVSACLSASDSTASTAFRCDGFRSLGEYWNVADAARDCARCRPFRRHGCQMRRTKCSSKKLPEPRRQFRTISPRAASASVGSCLPIVHTASTVCMAGKFLSVARRPLTWVARVVLITFFPLATYSTWIAYLSSA
ncbi:hypothetical protein OE88DRAFT_305610 [Heliocybe sulcata]|uniref:Uncharacterized protein n=1 Tax=Heliocybe sulcata TaxID=5364 RepID=A0A5C3MXJ3_9AGAM|nr:hypothetical protein OE88DRAFT_305610 [Heliocybe sulcata]